MKDRLLLSICIPTYNRAKYLDEAIKSIVAQITNDIKDKVEICISDNASTDNTDEIVMKWKEISPIPIIYSKNAVNLGADKNYLKVVEIANGEYCWFLGSDDKLCKNSLKELIDLISERKPAFFIVGRRVFDKNLKTELRKDLIFKDNGKFYRFENVKDLFDTLFIRLGYISSYIIYRPLWVEVVNNDSVLEEFFNGYVHIYILLSALQSFNIDVYYVNIPAVCYRSDNDSFLKELGNWKRWELDLNGYLKLYKMFLSKKDFKYMKKKLLLKHLRSKLLELKLNSCESNELFQKIFNTYKINSYFWYQVAIFYFLPSTVIKILKNFKKKVNL